MHLRGKMVRARRVLCNNRNRSTGCRRSFSVWGADRIKRPLLTADCLWELLTNLDLAVN